MNFRKVERFACLEHQPYIELVKSDQLESSFEPEDDSNNKENKQDIIRQFEKIITDMKDCGMNILDYIKLYYVIRYMDFNQTLFI